jgi:hypothetical protein
MNLDGLTTLMTFRNQTVRVILLSPALPKQQSCSSDMVMPGYMLCHTSQVAGTSSPATCLRLWRLQ